MICNKADTGKLCADCYHGNHHERVLHCGYSKCVLYANKFAEQNISCELCSLRDDCFKHKELIENKIMSIDLLKEGEDCPEYRKRIIYAKCI